MRPALDTRQGIQMFLPPQSAVFTGLAACFLAACGGESRGVGGSGSEAVSVASAASAPAVRPGVEVLLTDSAHLVAGRRVGLVTNHTGVYWAETGPEASADEAVGHVIDALFTSPDVELVALYGPEHGIRGVAEAGARVDTEVDERTGVTVFSLYGETLRPTPDMLEGVEVLVFDMQDIGARYYTYVSTMAYVMEAAGEAGIPFVVLDRPNPIRGDVVQGNILDPAFASFVGLYPVPMRHGMTPGELARMYVAEYGIDVDLRVVPMEGWRRSMTYDETGLPWVPPSPNMPSLESALAYPGTCLFEGTPLSVGRGTDRAFQWVGAPWLDGDALAAALEEYGFQGVRFEGVSFTPETPGDGKFGGEEIHGVRVVGESAAYDASRVAVAMLVETRRASGSEWFWRDSHFDRLAGTDALRLGIEAGQSVDDLTDSWTEGLQRFEATRAPYLIYP